MKKKIFYEKLILLTALVVGSFSIGMSTPLLSSNLLTSEVSIPKPDSVTVYLFFRIDCKICEYYTRDLEKLYEQYKEDKGNLLSRLFFKSRPNAKNEKSWQCKE